MTRHTARLLREVRAETAVLEDRFTGERHEIACAVLVHCGHRLPDEDLYLTAPGTPRVGDCVAPRSVLEAVLEARRAALELDASLVPPTVARQVASAGQTGPQDNLTGPLAGAR